MQRYEAWSQDHPYEDDNGEYVLHSEAQTEIAKHLEEIERLQAVITSMLNAKENDVPHIRNTAWNDAIEAAANLSKKSTTEGGVAKSMPFFAKSEDHWVYSQACLAYVGAILTLKK